MFPAAAVNPTGAAGGVVSEDVAEADMAEREKPVEAVPDNATDDGLPDALWAMDREADLEPTDEGVKVTVTVCAAAPALIVKEVGLRVNCTASVPDTLMPDTVSAAVPVLDTVNACVPDDPIPTFPNDSEEDDWL